MVCYFPQHIKAKKHTQVNGDYIDFTWFYQGFTSSLLKFITAEKASFFNGFHRYFRCFNSVIAIFEDAGKLWKSIF